MGPAAVLVPFGILEISRGPQKLDQLWLAFGTSCETSDFIADALDQWWDERGPHYEGVKRLQIELDNGPEINSSRTQFMKRLVAFADRTGLEIELVYLPPYHSKYNPIERCWGVLENHWNGALLCSTETVLNWASTMTWRGIEPIVHLVEKVYERGVRLTSAAFRPITQPRSPGGGTNAAGRRADTRPCGNVSRGNDVGFDVGLVDGNGKLSLCRSGLPAISRALVPKLGKLSAGRPVSIW